MLKFEIKKGNYLWNKDERRIYAALREREHYLNFFMVTHKYLYLNDIYEALGIEWDTTKENELFILDENVYPGIQLEVIPVFKDTKEKRYIVIVWINIEWEES